MVSYYYFLVRNGRFEGSFLEFLGKKDLNQGLWHEHVESWLLRENLVNMLLIRYQELHCQPKVEVRRMARFVGLPCDQARLDWAIANSSFETMQGIEAEKGLMFNPKHQFPIIRKGIVGDWKNHFEVAHKDVFKSWRLEESFRGGSQGRIQELREPHTASIRIRGK
jgi:hypothetical protein